MWVIIIQHSQNVEVLGARSQTNEVPGIFSNRNVFGFSVFHIQVNFFHTKVIIVVVVVVVVNVVVVAKNRSSCC